MLSLEGLSEKRIRKKGAFSFLFGERLIARRPPSKACRPRLFFADYCLPARRNGSMDERDRSAIRSAYGRRPSGLWAGSPPSPPPRLIRPIVRLLPRSPGLSGPGPH